MMKQNTQCEIVTANLNTGPEFHTAEPVLCNQSPWAQEAQQGA